MARDCRGRFWHVRGNGPCPSFPRRASFLRRLFRAGCPIMDCVDERRGGRDGDLRGQRVCAERGHGLSAFFGHGPAGGAAAPAETLSAGGPGRRGLCRGGVPAGRRVPGRRAGQAGGGRPAGAAGFRRGGKAPAADFAAVHHCLRLGGMRFGPGAAGGRRGPGGKRRLLYGCGRQGPTDRGHRGLFGDDGGVPGGGKARRRRRAAAGAGLHRWARRGADRPLGQRQRPPGPGGRPAGAGGGAWRPGQLPAPGGLPPADAGGAGGSGGPAGAGAPGGPGAAAPPAAVSRRGNSRRTAAGRADGLGGDRRNQVRRHIGGAVAHVIGNRLHGPVGRRSQKGRKP